METSTTKGRRCFKCQGIGHIAYDCPNKNIVTLIEEESEEEKEANDKVQSDEEDVELIQPDQGVSLIVQRTLKATCEMREKLGKK